MGFWGVLWELAKLVVPHTAPHVARVVTERARERHVGRPEEPRGPSTEDLAGAISFLEKRLSESEDRAAAAEEKASQMEDKLSAAEARFAQRWAVAGRWMIGLLVWNVLLTGLLIYLLARR